MIASTYILEILEQAKIEPPQARAITRAIEEAEKNLAEDFKGVLNERLQACATKEDLATMEMRLIKWMMTFAVSQSIIVLGGVVFLLTRVPHIPYIK
ncbi:MAG: hypothetical protein ACOY3I_07790 [Verrucomicrobiota bacterium]